MSNCECGGVVWLDSPFITRPVSVEHDTFLCVLSTRVPRVMYKQTIYNLGCDDTGPSLITAVTTTNSILTWPRRTASHRVLTRSAIWPRSSLPIAWAQVGHVEEWCVGVDARRHRHV